MVVAQLFHKQRLMRKVLVSLIPIILCAIYLFGLRVLVLLSFVILAAIITEYLILYSIDGKQTRVSEAVLVTAFLYTLTLPVHIPVWVAVVGVVFGILFGKGVYGGFGKNIFNPALLGRCFVYITFPKYMTTGWLVPFSGFPGGFVHYMPGADAVSGATPLTAFNRLGVVTAYPQLLLGHISGSLGETCSVLLLLIAVYLIMSKTASWRIMLAAVVSFILISSCLYITGLPVPPPIFALLTGGFLFGTVFMATDPVTAPKQSVLQIVYGSLIGILTVIIRSFANFTEGFMFAVLLANALVPLMELKLHELRTKRVIS